MPDLTIDRAQAARAAVPVNTDAAPAKKGHGRFARLMCAVAEGALNVVAPGAGTLIGELAGGDSDPAAQMKSVLDENQKSMASMFALQNKVQNQTQSFALLTNIMKAKHDAEMAAVHNLKG